MLDVAYTRGAAPAGGRVAALASLARWGALRALGARRGWKAKVVPIALILVAMGPALVVLGVRALFSEFSERAPIDILEVLPYADYQSVIGVVILIFAVVLAPELLCPDRRDGTLALYFATAVGRDEYVLGRFIAAAGPLLLVTLAPMLVLYGGVTFFSASPVDYVSETWDQVPRILLAGVLLAVYYASIALAVASFTGRRAYAIGGYVLLMVAVTAVAVLVQEGLGRERWFELAELSDMPIVFVRQLFPGVRDDVSTPLWGFALAYAAIVATALWVLVRRYRRERV